MEYLIRKANRKDIGRIAEILVFNNRKYYYPIFKNIEYSFREFNVIDLAEEFLNDPEFMDHCYVHEDKVIRGFICVVGGEIRKLYVDTFFQGEGIGSALLGYGINYLSANRLWAVEKNYYAIDFYARFGFKPNGEKCLEENTEEFLVKLVRL